MTQGESFESPSRVRRPVVLALLGDLMLSVRVQATVEALGYEFRSADELQGLRDALKDTEPDLVVYDLTAPAFPLDQTVAVMDEAGAERARVVAFFPHVMAELGRSARQARFSVVVPRSRFVNDMAGLLRGAMQGDSIALEEPDSAARG